MNAGTRTTNPATQQIEAEARERFPELDHKYASMTYPAEAMRSHNRAAFESGARWAALVAAQDAAPPVNSFDASSEPVNNGADSLHVAPRAESADCDRDGMGICKRCGMGWDARKVLDGDFACPVLPSSTVDEGYERRYAATQAYIDGMGENDD